jgi:tripeptide aminopeptidase
MATLPSNVSHEVPTIGFCFSFFDTTPDFTGFNVTSPNYPNYDGRTLFKCRTKHYFHPAISRFIAFIKDKLLITTDGTTLLGADDKAGITEVVATNGVLD